jgi:hypothetical protein
VTFGVVDRRQNPAQVAVFVRVSAEIVAQCGRGLRMWLVRRGDNRLVSVRVAVQYWRADPVTEDTVACTPSGLQSGAAAADRAPTIPIVMPPSTQPAPAARGMR